MTVLERCTCGADCAFASEECEGYVKPVGADDNDFIHACHAHRETACAVSKSYFGDDYDWSKPGLRLLPTGQQKASTE